MRGGPCATMSVAGGLGNSRAACARKERPGGRAADGQTSRGRGGGDREERMWGGRGEEERVARRERRQKKKKKMRMMMMKKKKGLVESTTACSVRGVRRLRLVSSLLFGAGGLAWAS